MIQPAKRVLPASVGQLKARKGMVLRSFLGQKAMEPLAQPAGVGLTSRLIENVAL
jgi:hypothetical protein